MKHADECIVKKLRPEGKIFQLESNLTRAGIFLRFLYFSVVPLCEATGYVYFVARST